MTKGQFLAIDGSMRKESNRNLSLSLDFLPKKSKLSLYVIKCIHTHKNTFALAEMHQYYCTKAVSLDNTPTENDKTGSFFCLK